MDAANLNLPTDDLHAAADSDAARATIDALHAELAKETPSPDVIASHVQTLSEQPKLFAIVSNWFEDPRVQTFLGDLSSAGL